MNQHFAITPFSMNSAQARGDLFSSLVRQATMGLINLMDWVLNRLENSRDRAVLARMEERELKDIGLTRSDIERTSTTMPHRG